MAAVRETAALPGVKAIIFKSPCIALEKPKGMAAVDGEKCIGCKKCIKSIGCPALTAAGGKVAIDPAQCTGCGLCTGLCPTGAISVTEGGR